MFFFHSLLSQRDKIIGDLQHALEMKNQSIQTLEAEKTEWLRTRDIMHADLEHLLHQRDEIAEVLFRVSQALTLSAQAVTGTDGPRPSPHRQERALPEDV